MRSGFSTNAVSAIIKFCVKNVKNKTYFIVSLLFRSDSQMKDSLSIQWDIWGPNVSNSIHISLFAAAKIRKLARERLEHIGEHFSHRTRNLETMEALGRGSEAQRYKNQYFTHSQVCHRVGTEEKRELRINVKMAIFRLCHSNTTWTKFQDMEASELALQGHGREESW